MTVTSSFYHEGFENDLSKRNFNEFINHTSQYLRFNSKFAEIGDKQIPLSRNEAGATKNAQRHRRPLVTQGEPAFKT
jgi:hypothetical protein